MASYTLPNTPFPSGTSVSAYDAQGYSTFPAGGPPGSPVATATVTAGSLTFTGLTNHRSYFAAAKVGGEWKSWRFSVGENGPPPRIPQDIDFAGLAAGKGPVVNSEETGYEFADLLRGARCLEDFVSDAGEGDDDTAAWEAAASSLTASGKALLLQPGKTYKIESETIEAWSGMTILGFGATLDILADGTAHGRRLLLENVEGCQIGPGLRLICSNAATRTQDYGVLSILGGGNHSIDLFEIDGSEGTGVWVGVNVDDLELIVRRVKNTKADGVHLSRALTNFRVGVGYGENCGDDVLAVVSYKKDGAVEYDPCSNGILWAPIVSTFAGSNGKALAIVGGKNITAFGGSCTGSEEAGASVAQEAGENPTHPAEDIRLVGFRAFDLHNEDPEENAVGINVSGTRVSLDDCDVQGCDEGLNGTGSTDLRANGGTYRNNDTDIYENGATGMLVEGADLRESTINAPNTRFYACPGKTPNRVVVTAANKLKVPGDTDLLVVTGDTEIKEIENSTTRDDGTVLKLRFSGIPKVVDGGTEKLILNGNLECLPNTTLTLLYDKGNFYELGRCKT